MNKVKGRHVVQYTNLSQLCLQQTGQCNERETYDVQCKKMGVHTCIMKLEMCILHHQPPDTPGEPAKGWYT